MDKLLKISELITCETDYLKPLFEAYTYPWEILPHIKEYIKELLQEGIEGFTEWKPGVLVGKNVKIYDTATIEGNCIIGDNTEIRPGAFLRGNVICGKDCVLGNSSEFKNAVLLNHVQAPHYNYVGDSILGNFAHMGAGAVCSNLKSDGKNVVIHGDKDYETGLRKIGAIMADRADIGCGSILNPGTIVGKNTSVYPLTALRGVYPADCIVKSAGEMIKRQ